MIQQFARGAITASVTGAGPAVWLLHSLLADAGSCGPLAAMLSGRHRVVAPDLPGFGPSAPVGPGLDHVADRLAEAIEDLWGEVRGLLFDRPPSAPELEDARRSLIEGQARHFETPSALVSRYAGLFLHGLPPDHHAGFAERLGAVTLSSLEGAAIRRVDPRAFVFVVVADADLVAGPLEALGWVAVERHDERDTPVTSRS